jgi:hypothetical protein
MKFGALALLVFGVLLIGAAIKMNPDFDKGTFLPKIALFAIGGICIMIAVGTLAVKAFIAL